jgi:metal-responsive CopG/Arc/MetJ family transcriptional regulator
MTESRKLKISVSLPADLVAAVDRRARSIPGDTRSGVVERWLRRGVREQAEADLRDEVIRYYTSRSEKESEQDQELSRALSRAARRIDIDGAPPRPIRKRSR